MNIFKFYNSLLERKPIRTKAITSSLLYGVGDFLS